MVKREKKTKKFGKTVKRTEKPDVSTDDLKVIWAFDNIDKDGPFAFAFNSVTFPHKEILGKMISYASMTWTELDRQTHDAGKSKNHFLEFESLSKEAKERFKYKFPEFDTADSIFSFALQNKLRIIGVRDGQIFHAIWYDPEHKFCPSHKR